MISEYACVDVRERLEAFHDGELSIDERIAIQHHLGECGRLQRGRRRAGRARLDAARSGGRRRRA